MATSAEATRAADQITFAHNSERQFARLLDFYRDVRAEIGHEQNEAARRTSENIAMHLAEVAEDVRLDGVVIVTDHGDATQKRFLGL
jgi:pyruvate kinase